MKIGSEKCYCFMQLCALNKNTIVAKSFSTMFYVLLLLVFGLLICTQSFDEFKQVLFVTLFIKAVQELSNIFTFVGIRGGAKTNN